jgi:methylamine---corrinoid protein Co-methyltransferase
MKLDYLDIVNRSYTGKKITKDDWDYKYIIETTQEMVEKYEITWDKEDITPDNPELADKIFFAAKE